MKRRVKYLMQCSIVLFVGCHGLSAWADAPPVLPPPKAKLAPERTLRLTPWPAGKGPRAPRGYKVSVFAEIESPRSILVLPSGDILVAQAKRLPKDPRDSSPSRITKFEIDSKGNAIATDVFLDKVDQPFGMAVTQDSFFVATPTQVLKYPMVDEVLSGPGVQIANLPFPGPRRHWIRYLLVDPETSKLLVSVGSVQGEVSNDSVLESNIASIIQMNLDGTEIKDYVSGIGQVAAMAIEPKTKSLWGSVNIEPRYLVDVTNATRPIRPSGGWPHGYWQPGTNQNRDKKLNDIFGRFTSKIRLSSTSLVFTEGTEIGPRFEHGALLTQYGSSSDSKPLGYKVIYVPFENGQAVGPEEDFLTGFIASQEKGRIFGRPVMAAILNQHQVLVVDDVGNRIWKVSKTGY